MEPSFSTAARAQAPFVEASGRNEAHSSGVTWAAVIAGAFATAALSLALLALGTGIGFSAVSPWVNAGASASAIGWTAIGWLVLMQLIASSAGGYLAGRLRTKWVNVHTHEVYFRDTAHGFLAWAVGQAGKTVTVRLALRPDRLSRGRVLARTATWSIRCCDRMRQAPTKTMRRREASSGSFSRTASGKAICRQQTGRIWPRSSPRGRV